MPQLQRAEQLISKYVTRQQSLQHLNAFINLPPKESSPRALPTQFGPLDGEYVGIKDNICTTDLPTTCASAGLRNFVSPYDATVVERLLKMGATIAGKTNLDEFGMGSHAMHSFFGAVSTEGGHSAGGSSGGSAVAVATGQCSSALGTDTGGSVRLPAAYNNIVGFKPSYGLVSRWGVVAYANSLDTVGFLGPDISSVRRLFRACNAHDAKDPTSLSPRTRSRISTILKRRDPPAKLRIGIPKEYHISTLSTPARTAWLHTIKSLHHHQGHTIHAVTLPHTPEALSAYYILAPAEASSNLAKYDGVRYGEQSAPDASVPSPHGSESPQRSSPGNTLYTATRASFFGPEVRRRILLGAYTLSAEAINNYFLRAQKIRRLVAQDFDRVFALPHPIRDQSDKPAMPEDRGVDYLLTPTAPSPPPRLDEVRAALERDPTQQYASDVFTVPASLAGLPAVSVPVEGHEGVGVQIVGQFGDDEGVLEAAEVVMGER